MLQKIASLIVLANGLSATNCDNCTATCLDTGTVVVTIPFTRNATVLSMSYGTCNATSAGVRHSQDEDDYSFELTLDSKACGMDGKLRSLEYDQTVTDVRIGVESKGYELEWGRFQIDSWCSYNDTYEVVFDYGTLNTDAQTFNKTGGEIGYQFAMAACKSSECNNHTQEHSTRGGDSIYLELYTKSQHFDFTTKKFAPLGCTINDTVNNILYTLFETDSTDNCTNTDVDFVMTYDSDKHTWKMSHILFLLGSYAESSFNLICDVIVCDFAEEDSRCNSINTNCGVGVNGKECIDKQSDPKGEMYTGKMTDSECITWFENQSGDKYKPTDGLSHTDKSSSHAYCRNPDKGEKPWCYIKTGGWKYCAQIDDC